MDKQSLLEPFTAAGRKQLKEGAHARHVEKAETDEQKALHKMLKERDAWKKILVACSPGQCSQMLIVASRHEILSVMFVIQISINLNASLYANGVVSGSLPELCRPHGMLRLSSRRHLEYLNRLIPQLIFLCAYAFGCRSRDRHLVA